MLILEIKYYFNIFLNKIYFKKQFLQPLQPPSYFIKK
jgi:hypothetical protein